MARTLEIEQKIDSDFAGRCWDGLWANPLGFLLTVVTTDLLRGHVPALIGLTTVFIATTLFRLTVLMRRDWFGSSETRRWRSCLEALVLSNGLVWGLISAFCLYSRGYSSADGMLLMLYISAVATGAASLLVHNPRSICIYLFLLYGPLCAVQVFRPAERWWAPFCSFGLYSAFLAIHAARNHREYMSRILDNQALLQIAKQDFLTGLPNRFCLERQLEAEVSQASESGESLALLFIDLNGFKKINDNYSHEIGDHFLREISGRIQRCSGPGTTLARLGGDEFAVLITGSPERETVRQHAQKLLDAIRVPVYTGGYTLTGGASVGISFFPNDAANPGDLLRVADQAMYQAKRRGGSRFQFADEADEDSFTFVSPERTGHTLAQWATVLHAVNRADRGGSSSAVLDRPAESNG